MTDSLMGRGEALIHLNDELVVVVVALMVRYGVVSVSNNGGDNGNGGD